MDDDELAVLPPLMLLMLPTLIRELHCHFQTHAARAMGVPDESAIAIKDLSRTLGRQLHRDGKSVPAEAADLLPYRIAERAFAISPQDVRP